MMQKRKIAIVGAGLAGLSCARRLVREHGERVAVVVFEKSRSFGGRCATRRFHEHVVDHGAQWFTASGPAFQEFLEELPDGERLPLTTPIVTFDGKEFPSPHGSRYYLRHGNNTLGRQMGGEVEVRRETLVDLVEKNGGGDVTLAGETFDAAVLTTPLPQMARLLNQPEPEGYIPNLTGFFEYDGDPTGPAGERYALLDRGEEIGSPLAWSACENHKQGRIAPGKSVFVVQASAGFSRKFVENEPDTWLPRLQEELEKLWELDKSRRGRTFGHRWRFARVEHTLEMPFDLPDGVFAAGDFQKKSRVEAAWMTGWETAAQVADYLGLAP